MENRFELFTLLIAKINRGLKKIKTSEMEEFGLKSVHVNCLYFLYKYEEMTAVKLCELTTEDKAGISRSLDFLEKTELIECQEAGKKRYNAVLRLTDQGKNVAEKIVEKIDRYIYEIGLGLTDENRRILYESLLLISKNIDSVCTVR